MKWRNMLSCFLLFLLATSLRTNHNVFLNLTKYFLCVTKLHSSKTNEYKINKGKKVKNLSVKVRLNSCPIPDVSQAYILLRLSLHGLWYSLIIQHHRMTFSLLLFSIGSASSSLIIAEEQLAVCSCKVVLCVSESNSNVLKTDVKVSWPWSVCGELDMRMCCLRWSNGVYWFFKKKKKIKHPHRQKSFEGNARLIDSSVWYQTNCPLLDFKWCLTGLRTGLLCTCCLELIN